MFHAEEKGLNLLSAGSTFSIPASRGSGVMHDRAYLLLDWVEKGRANDSFWEDFGTSLAQLHQNTNAYFGLDHDNFIGKLPQSNTYHDSWYAFFVQERLLPQIKLASDKGLVDHKICNDFERLFPQLPEVIPNELPALLHGDLWSGNFLVGEESNPVLIDPAVYYGHRETELAFTHLFGGFDPLFYQSYASQFPLEQGFEERIAVHNLYPLLVHVNLFGNSYLSGIKQTLRRFT